MTAKQGMDGGNLYYDFEPLADRPVLMLSNSLGANLSMWSPQVESLRRHYSLLRYDARGHGRSAVLPGPYTIEAMGQDVLLILDSLAIDRVHFCGLSMGGMVGQWLGAHAPQRIEKLVLSNTAAKIGTSEGWNARIAAVQQGGMEAIVPVVMTRWFTPSFLDTKSPLADDTRAMLLAMSTEGYTASCAAVRDMDQRADLHRIIAPTLVIYGTHDEVTPPAAADELLAGIAGSLALPLDAAHLSNVEAADAFTQGVSEFLSRS